MHQETSTTVVLPSGTLRLRYGVADWDLEQLCGFAARANPKRGYLFVSKVLGKHIPVRPRLMARVYRDLANQIPPLSGPTTVIGMAETATALAQGIFDEWTCRADRTAELGRATDNAADSLFLHTTRYALDRPLALEFAESHSHAPQHLLYRPVDTGQQRVFSTAEHLILIDDEISTGATLANLARAYQRVNAKLRSLHIVSLTNWLPGPRRESFAASVGIPTTFHQLLSGEFEFQPDPRFRAADLKTTTAPRQFYDDRIAGNFGRTGMLGPPPFTTTPELEDLDLGTASRILVLGTGEFAYPPWLLARQLEERGFDVFFQTTTRSPIMLGDPIGSRLATVDNYGEGIANYVYNLPRELSDDYLPHASGEPYDHILIGYETPRPSDDHRLASRLKAVPILFTVPDTSP